MSTPFANLLGKYLQRTHTSVNRLAILSGVPQRTIANWLNGYVLKPHQWQSIVRVASALHLSEVETNVLLQTANHPPLNELRLKPALLSERPILDGFQPSISTLPHPPFQTIADLPTFIGRSVELEKIKEILLNDKRAAICGLRGMGGVGKTTLAAHLAYQLRDNFPDGVLWARLDVSDPLSILGAFAEAYGRDVSGYKDVESRASIVRNLLTEKRALIILDNAESSAQVRALLPPSTSSNAVLVTTRYDLSILDGYEQLTLKPFDTSSGEAIELFIQYLGEDFVHAHQGELLEIADLLGHLPLALAIIAGRLAKNLTFSITQATKVDLVANLLTSLQRPPARLDLLKRDGLGVRVSFDISFNQLCLFQQDLFSILGIFSGEGFTSNAVAYLVSESLNIVEVELIYLQSLSLIQESRDKLWSLHPLLQDYARERLDANGQLISVIEKMLLMYRQAAYNEWSFSRSLDEEIPNIRFALDKAIQLKLHQQLLETVLAIYPTLYKGAWFSLAQIALGYAREAARVLNDPKTDLHLLKEVALIQLGLGDHKNGRENLLLAFRLAQSTNSEEAIIDVLFGLGKLEHDTGHRRQANIYLEEALALARKTEIPYLISRGLNSLAANILAEARYKESRKMFLEALEISRTQKQGEAPHRILMNLGELSWQIGDWEQAKSYWLEALPLARMGKYRAAIVSLLADLAKIYALQNEWAKAEQSCKEAILQASEINSPRVESIARGELGEIFRQQNKFDESLDQLTNGKELADQSGDMERKCIILQYLGLLYLDWKKLTDARTTLNEALITAKEINHEIIIAKIYFAQAKVSIASGKLNDSKKWAKEASRIYKQFGLSDPLKEIQYLMRTLTKTPRNN